jgi:hypothetical protein
MTALNISGAGSPIITTPNTSGVYTFSVPRDTIIRLAMLDIGALQEGESPTAQEISDCAVRLNMIAKQWMGDTDFSPGLKVWTRKRAELFMQGGQYTYQIGQTGLDNWIDSTTGLTYPTLYGSTTLTAAAAKNATSLSVGATAQANIGDFLGVYLGSSIYWTTVTTAGAGVITIPSPGLSAAAAAGSYVWNYTTKAVRPIRIITALLRDIYANDTTLRMMTVERYESLPSKTMASATGDPTAIFYEPRFKQQNPNGQIYLDVGAPADVTKHLHIVYLAPVEDFVNPGDAPDYSQEWLRPLVLQLGKDIHGMFDCSWDLESSLQEALAIARQANPATTDIYFEVNSDDPYGY